MTAPVTLYFVEACGLGFVKVGYTRGNVKERLDVLSTGCPAPLRVLVTIPSTRSAEDGLHREFRAAGLHAHGAWFKRSPELDRFISALTQWRKSRVRRLGPVPYRELKMLWRRIRNSRI